MFGGASVGREADGSPAVIDDEPEGLDAVRHRHWRDGQSPAHHRHHRLEDGRPQKGVFGARKLEEVGPHPAIEDVAVEELEDLRCGEQFDTVGARLVDVLEEDRQAGDVVEVFVGDEHVADRPLAFEIGQKANRTGVDRHGVVDDERHEELRVRRRDARGQKFDPHGAGSSGWGRTSVGG